MIFLAGDGDTDNSLVIANAQKICEVWSSCSSRRSCTVQQYLICILCLGDIELGKGVECDSDTIGSCADIFSAYEIEFAEEVRSRLFELVGMDVDDVART